MRLLITVLLLAQMYPIETHDEVYQNPARFRQVTWDSVLVVPKSGTYILDFPDNISTYRMPACELTNAKTGKPADLTWDLVHQGWMVFHAPPGERIKVHCQGYELKPWRKDR